MDIPIDLLKETVHELKKLGSENLANKLKALITEDCCGSCGKAGNKRNPHRCLECAMEADAAYSLRIGAGMG